MKKSFCLFLIMGFCFSLFSQKKFTRKQFTKDSLYIMRIKLARPQFRIDNKITFYNRQTLNINGFDAGVLLKEKLRLTLGYYSLNDDLSFYDIKTEVSSNENRKLKLKYGTLNIEFIYLNTRFFSLGIPLEFGFGKNKLIYTGTQNVNNRSGLISIIDFGLSGTFKPIRWVGLKCVAGYRKTITNQIKDFNFNGYFISTGLAINIREISKDIQMFMLKRKYKRLGNPLETAVDLITD